MAEPLHDDSLEAELDLVLAASRANLATLRTLLAVVLDQLAAQDRADSMH